MSKRKHATLPAFTPVPRLKDRSNGWKPEVQRAFIEALADTGSVASACRMVRRSTHGAYHLRRQPGAASFAKAWQAALDLGMQRVEDTAMDRALNGVEIPVYSYGKLVGSRITYNDRLLMFMLRNRAPERFTEGRARGLNAIDKAELTRLKKQWRKEWEAQAGREAMALEEDVYDSIDEKIDTMRDRWLDQMSPRTRTAYEAYQACVAEDEASGYKWWEDPAHPINADGGAADGEEDEGTMALPPPGWGEKKVVEPDEGPRIRSLKDEGWD